MATAATPTRATIDDLARFEGKAELIGGRVVPLMSPGHTPSQISLEIAIRLRDYARSVGHGFAYADGMIFHVPALPSGRESFVPDASYYAGPRPAKRMRFVEGPPTLAVEVRSEHDYGASAERQMAEKRADYFAAGTPAVWDVDPETELIHVYRHEDPLNPTTYARGQEVEGGPVLPGFGVGVDAVFDQD